MLALLSRNDLRCEVVRVAGGIKEQADTLWRCLSVVESLLLLLIVDGPKAN